jgi:prevent-host-death family protein
MDMTINVNMQEAKTQLSKLVISANRGDTVIIANRGVPVATLEPVKKAMTRQLGFIKCPLPDSFFDPLSDEELNSWEL